MDRTNGGYITPLLLDGEGAGLAAFLGCRPTDDTTKVGQARNVPDQEHKFIPNTP